MKHAPLMAREISGPFMQLWTNLQGDNGHEVLSALKKFNRKENPWPSGVIAIDRTTPFKPTTFLVDNSYHSKLSAKLHKYSLVKMDKKSLDLTEVDLSKVTFENGLQGEEKYISDYERIERLLAQGKTLLDMKVFQTLWENKHLIPKAWEDFDGGDCGSIDFYGTVLREEINGQLVVCMFFSEGEWRFILCHFSRHHQKQNSFAAVI
jgi:hypothetical protein